MVGRYDQTSGSLELRKPAVVFTSIAWLLAGPANPASFFAFAVYGREFDLLEYFICLAIPLSAACGVALWFLRGGGFGFVTLTLITVFVAYLSCAASGPIVTLSLWAMAQIGFRPIYMPIDTMAESIITSGTYIRLALFLVAVPIVPAALILRIVAFRREAKKKQPLSTANIL